jgi:hypothetical protein
MGRKAVVSSFKILSHSPEIRIGYPMPWARFKPGNSRINMF